MQSFARALFAAATLCAASLRATADSIAPSAALSATFQELTTNRTEQKAIADRHLAQAQKDDLSAAERFALAELYFVALKPDEARDAFRPFLDGKDLRARLAWQRLMRMTAVAYKDYERVERLVREYRTEFPADPRDPYHTYAGTQALVAHYKSKGEHGKIVDVIMAELEALPADHPCYVASLIAPNFPSFQAVNRTEDAIAAVKQKGALLRQLGQQGYTGWPADEVPRLEEIRNPQSFFEKILAGYERRSPAAPKASGS